MRKGLRYTTTKESVASIKDFKKQVVTRTAQRKFAGNVQTNSSSSSCSINRESTRVSATTPKTEDFINFLCLRDAPFLPAELECFADPIQVSNPVHNEIFRNTEFDESDRCTGVVVEPTAKRRCFDVDNADSDDGGGDELTDVACQELMNVDLCQPSDAEFKHFFTYVDTISREQRHRHLIHIKPSSEWKCPSYVQDGLKIDVKTTHVHRLKLPVCDNFMKLQYLRKQLEKDGVSMKDLPCLGLCEVDLPRLMEVVNTFGGVDSVNSDQNWRALADRLRIPKSASRRVSQLEKIYLKYILPYDLLPKADKTKLEETVKKTTKRLKEIDKFSSWSKTISLETFHRLACNALFYYCDVKDKDTVAMEEFFWKLVAEGDRHFAAYSGEVDLHETPQAYQNPKMKVHWKLSTLYSHEKSAFRYLGKFSKISVPWLTAESVFSLCEWTCDEHDFFTLSYLHAGTDRVWYVVPASFSNKVCGLIKQAEEERTFVTPEDMVAKGIQVLRCVQQEGQYVIVEPGCYYCTLSTGYSLSETVKFMKMEWFKRLEGIDIKLDDYVEIKMVLNYINETNKTNYCPYKEVLIRKLDSINLLLSNSVSRLTDSGVKDIKYLKSMPKEADICCACDASCYLVSVTFDDIDGDDDKSDDEFDAYCLDHALKMIKSKKSKASEATGYVFLSTNRVNQMIAKLKTKSEKC